MIRIRIFLCLMFGLSACVNRDNVKTHYINQQQLWQDSFKYVIVKLDSVSQISYLNPQPSDISFEQLQLVDSLLKAAVDSYNVYVSAEYERLSKEHADYSVSKENFVITLREYVKQVVAYKNQAGENEVWINCYHGEDISDEIVDVRDGGNYFFNVKINLSTKRVYDFSVNGDV